MSDELSYRISVLLLFTDALELIQADPQTCVSTREVIGEVLSWGRGAFPVVIDDAQRSDHVARLHDVANVFRRSWDVSMMIPKRPTLPER